MFFNFAKAPTEKLTALRFLDSETFRKAARVAAEHNVPAQAPGYDTLIVRKSDKKLFAAKHLKFDEEPVANAEKVDAKELSKLRHRHLLGK